jgi:hypothetical protein
VAKVVHVSGSLLVPERAPYRYHVSNELELVFVPQHQAAFRAIEEAYSCAWLPSCLLEDSDRSYHRPLVQVYSHPGGNLRLQSYRTSTCMFVMYRKLPQVDHCPPSMSDLPRIGVPVSQQIQNKTPKQAK